VDSVAIAAPAELQFAGASGSASNGIKMGYAGALAYGCRGLIAAEKQAGTVADDPTTSFVSATPDANQGIQVHDVVQLIDEWSPSGQRSLAEPVTVFRVVLPTRRRKRPAGSLPPAGGR
jgi:hypothetical protein